MSARDYILCPWCDQPILPKGARKRPGEYDHAQGCPATIRRGDHVRILARKPNGDPHPHAGKTGIVSEAWITVDRLTVRVDEGIEPQGFIIVSRGSVEVMER